MMHDSRPFEYTFFKVISQDFPFLELLYILNHEPQKEKQQSTTPIIFPHLNILQLAWHVDYAEQFLVEKNCLTSFAQSWHQLRITCNGYTISPMMQHVRRVLK
jgi:hypothetical protein